ncbi:ferric-chelate reductase [Pseudomassariella vexata]|uniref:ferric-chelate reductase (NADPH) n=1 Tax=Pseudomassariella vexata TaxID=1141098 RepID=A0A1Y2DJ61_9PEZI|nr:ferric-chelate reductase [Pseudomassariella vexata]ORY59174.1 ferric-chelate reductase [Pseudomassariella vexata]
MGGMDMGSGMLQTLNMALARAYWYIIAGVLALLAIVRTLNYVQNWFRLRISQTKSVQYPTKPTNIYMQIWATMTAIGREMSYPQLYVPYPGLSWMTPPPMGRILVLLAYWAVIIYMISAGAIIKDAYFWERIAFRNAWVTVTQMPFLYLLASKTNVIGFITGMSYERLNWLHRWVARTMFVTASVHGWHFWTEWTRAEILEIELEMMPMVKYGLGAWGILLWMVVTSFKPFRSMAYEIFVVQHIIAAILFIYIVWVHVPDYARYNIWFTVAAICSDRAFRLALLAWQNIKFNPNNSRCKGGQRFGHQTQVTVVGDSMTILTVKDVHFKWRAGQHLYLWLPRVGAFEAHPYTIACPHQVPETCICNSVQLVIRSHSGFSKRLHTFATKMAASGKKQTLTALVAGPYGRPPRWDIFETLVLISASTGTSFTLPILESVLQTRSATCTKKIDFILTARQGEEIGFYHERLHEAIALAADRGIDLSVHIAVTGHGQLELIESSLSSASARTTNPEKKVQPVDNSNKMRFPITTDCEATGDQRRAFNSSDSTAVEKTSDFEAVTSSGCCAARKSVLPASADDAHIHHYSSRPDVAEFIRRAVEATGGETGVIVCGGTSLVSRVRTSVAKLSDERAVHKGTGAQGIHLHVEEYCF